MNNNGERERWHLSKAVPLSIIMFLAAQTIAVILWAAKLDARVDSLERFHTQYESRLVFLELAHSKLIVIEERQIAGYKILEAITKKIDAMSDSIKK